MVGVGVRDGGVEADAAAVDVVDRADLEAVLSAAQQPALLPLVPRSAWWWQVATSATLAGPSSATLGRPEAGAAGQAASEPRGGARAHDRSLGEDARAAVGVPGASKWAEPRLFGHPSGEPRLVVVSEDGLICWGGPSPGRHRAGGAVSSRRADGAYPHRVACGPSSLGMVGKVIESWQWRAKTPQRWGGRRRDAGATAGFRDAQAALRGA